MSVLSPREDSGMSVIVKTVTRLATGFIAIFGIAVVLYGHVSPGGGFAGGVIIASAFVLVVLAYGSEYASRFVTGRAASMWDSGGALGFLAVALLGYLGGHFFWNFLRPQPGAELSLFRLYSAGSIVLSNAAIGLKVGMGLFGIFFTLSVFRRGEAERNRD
jgi:multisubunit Na+/H+ antiporter MnhB subunit